MAQAENPSSLKGRISGELAFEEVVKNRTSPVSQLESLDKV
jgi:hypothetical protein